MTIFYTNALQKNNKIYYRGYDKGKPFTDIVDDYKPYIFLPAANGKYKTIFGEPCAKKEFKSLKAAYEFTKAYTDAGMKFYGLTNYVYPFLNDYFPGKITFDDSLISVVSLDIEVESRKGFPTVEACDQEINAITLIKKGKSITFGIKDYLPQNTNQTYHRFLNEKDLLRKFLEIWNTNEWSPDIVTGWSIDLFDIPYLYKRISKILEENEVKKLSPFRIIEAREIIRGKSGAYFKTFDDRKDMVYDIAGIATLDYLQLYKKFTFTNHPSYALNAIAKAELGESKTDTSEYKDLNDLYDRNPQLFFEYNIRDALLVDRLEDKLNFIKQVITIAYLAKVNYVDALVTLRPWDVIIHNFLLEKGIVIPQYEEKPYDLELLGGYVKNPIPGLYKWVVSFDFNSLYPSIISQCNISPETFMKKLHTSSPEHIIRDDRFPVAEDGESIITGNGCMYRWDIRGFIPEIVDNFIADRAAKKKQMIEFEKKHDKALEKEIEHLDHFQQALKIMTNALYGAISMKYFRWFSFDMAESITTTSQVCTRYVEREVNKYLNKLLKTDGIDYVIAADTDSIYVNLEPLVNVVGIADKPVEQIVEFIDKACKEKLQPFIEECCVHLCEKFAVEIPKLYMKRESICSKAIWRGSKMYAMNIYDKEGVRYKTPQVKSKGMEVVRSSTPIVCRDKLKKVIDIIFNKNEEDLQKFIGTFHSEFMQLPFETIAFPRSVNGMKEYYDPVTIVKPHTPIHVRGAIVYNEAIKAMELTKTHKLIQDRDKLRFIYLKTPNPFRSNVIAAPDDIPEEFEIEQYLDRELQWEKTFLGPVESLTSIIGWSTKPTATLLDFLK